MNTNDNNINHNKKIHVYDNMISSHKQKLISPHILHKIKDYLSKQNSIIQIKDALDAIIYGINCLKLTKKHIRKVIIFQQHTKEFILSIASKSQERVEQIDLSLITHLSFDSDTDITKRILHSSVKDCFIKLVSKQVTWNFMFNKAEDLTLFLKGILELFEIYTQYDANSILHQIKQIWFHYDINFSKSMEKNEFKLFTQDLNIAFNHNLDFNETFERIDSNSNGKIDFNEFAGFYKSYTDGHEYKELFFKYFKSKIYNDNNYDHNEECDDEDEDENDDDDDDEEPLLSAGQVRKFFQEEQKEKCSLWDVYKLIVSHKQSLSKQDKEALIMKIDKSIQFTKEERENLYMSLEEFKLMLHSCVTDVLDYQKINEGHDMNRPINDYFINSTHNTYLTGHQLTSVSSVDMYSFSLLEGYRLIELDCYNGLGDDIIITHGYTFTSSLILKDVLIQVKKYAFVSSSYPVILSIENHLDKEHQNIMAKMFKEILVDLYVLPQDNPPDYLPPLKEMKNKFIVKCGGTRITKDRKDIIPRKDIVYNKQLDISISNKDEFSIMPNIELFEYSQRFHCLLKNEMKLSFQKASSMNVIDMEKIKKLKKNEEIVSELSKVRGLFGTSFKLHLIPEKNYQPWEIVSLKFTKLTQYSFDYHKRQILIPFTQNTVMKAYPTGFDSSNFDPIKCWIVGCNIVAINIQSTEDDWTLLNMIFFTNNRNRGYVLKPAKLLPESTFIETYEKPYLKLTIQILTIIGLNKIINQEGIMMDHISKIKMKCFIVGSDMDNKQNKQYKCIITGDFLIPKIEMTAMISFYVYEVDLSAIYFKIYSDKTVIGRSVIPLMLMKEGARKIAIYDSNCIKFNESFIVTLIKKTQLNK